jgi:hypothetical protein
VKIRGPIPDSNPNKVPLASRESLELCDYNGLLSRTLPLDILKSRPINYDKQVISFSLSRKARVGYLYNDYRPYAEIDKALKNLGFVKTNNYPLCYCQYIGSSYSLRLCLPIREKEEKEKEKEEVDYRTPTFELLLNGNRQIRRELNECNIYHNYDQAHYNAKNDNQVVEAFCSDIGSSLGTDDFKSEKLLNLVVDKWLKDLQDFLVQIAWMFLRIMRNILYRNENVEYMFREVDRDLSILNGSFYKSISERIFEIVVVNWKCSERNLDMLVDKRVLYYLEMVTPYIQLQNGFTPSVREPLYSKVVFNPTDEDEDEDEDEDRKPLFEDDLIYLLRKEKTYRDKGKSSYYKRKIRKKNEEIDEPHLTFKALEEWNNARTRKTNKYFNRLFSTDGICQFPLSHSELDCYYIEYIIANELLEKDEKDCIDRIFRNNALMLSTDGILTVPDSVKKSIMVNLLRRSKKRNGCYGINDKILKFIKWFFWTNNGQSANCFSFKDFKPILKMVVYVEVFRKSKVKKWWVKKRIRKALTALVTSGSVNRKILKRDDVELLQSMNILDKNQPDKQTYIISGRFYYLLDPSQTLCRVVAARIKYGRIKHKEWEFCFQSPGLQDEKQVPYYYTNDYMLLRHYRMHDSIYPFDEKKNFRLVNA